MDGFRPIDKFLPKFSSQTSSTSNEGLKANRMNEINRCVLCYLHWFRMNFEERKCIDTFHLDLNHKIKMRFYKIGQDIQHRIFHGKCFDLIQNQMYVVKNLGQLELDR